MATTLLAAGTTSAQSADVVIADGARKSLMLIGTGAASGRVVVQYKRQDGTYKSHTTLNGVRRLAQFSGPITLRVNRPAQTPSVGVDQE